MYSQQLLEFWLMGVKLIESQEKWIENMQILDEFAKVINNGDIEAAKSLFAANSSGILIEHRDRVADEENYYVCFLNNLMNDASDGDEDADAAIQWIIEDRSFISEVDQSGFSFSGMCQSQIKKGPDRWVKLVH